MAEPDITNPWSGVLDLNAPAPGATTAPGAGGKPNWNSVLDIGGNAPGVATTPTQAPMGTGEAAARQFYKHLTFGTEPGADRALTEQAEREHPWLNMGTAAGAMVAQTAALGPLAWGMKGVQGLRWLGRAIELGLLPNTEARTALQVGRTGSKLGGVYAGAETAGHDLTDPNKTWGETGTDVAKSVGVGTALGFPLGVAAHGVGRGLGAAANRILPGLREARELAAAPEAQGMRDIARYGRYDKADFDQLAGNLRVKAPQNSGLNDAQAGHLADAMEAGASPEQLAQHFGLPVQTLKDIAAQEAAIRNRYADLNLIEALKTRELQPTAVGELKPGVATMRNLELEAKRAANTEGPGQNIAAEAFASRKNEMTSKIQQDVDRFFGSGDAAEAAQQALDKQAASLSKRYNRLRGKKDQLLSTEGLGDIQSIPEFQSALAYAAKNDLILNPESQFGKLWSSGKLNDTVVTLSPSNLLDVHHALVMNAKPPITGATPESVMAGKLKSFWTDFVDSKLSKHEALRTDYHNFKRIMDAQEAGANMPIKSGPRDHPSLTFLNKATEEYNAALKAVQAETAKFDAAMNRYNSGQRKTVPSDAEIKNAEANVASKQEVIDAFRRAHGDAIKYEFARNSENPGPILNGLLTQEGKRRLVQSLGPEQGRAFIESLYNKRMQADWGNTLYGGSPTAWLTRNNETHDALGKIASGIWHMRPSMIWQGTREGLSGAYKQQRADKVNEVFSQQGVDALRDVLGSLQQQNALRRTADPVRNWLGVPMGSGVAHEIGQPSERRPIPPYRP